MATEAGALAHLAEASDPTRDSAETKALVAIEEDSGADTRAALAETKAVLVVTKVALVPAKEGLVVIKEVMAATTTVTVLEVVALVIEGMAAAEVEGGAEIGDYSIPRYYSE